MNVDSRTPSEKRGRADHQLQKLEPDDLVNQGRAAAAGEQGEEARADTAARAS